MKLIIDQFLQKGLDALTRTNFKEAENCYRTILEMQPDNFNAHNFLGVSLNELGRVNEAEVSYKNAIKYKPDFAEAHYNLAVILIKSKKIFEGIKSYQDAIKYKPDFAEAHYNLGNVLSVIKRLKEAKKSYQDAIKYKPDFPTAHNNLGSIYLDLGDLKESELSFKKALSLKQDYIEAKSNIKLISSLKKVLFNIEKEKKTTAANLKILNPVMKLSPDPFVTNRSVKSNLINYLYRMNSRKLDETKDSRFGNGKCSIDFYLFDDDEFIIKSLTKDLVDIMCQAVGTKVQVIDSFFNIIGAGGGTKPHNHIIPFDNAKNLGDQKYSLVYYLSVGDQNCNEPGIFKLYEPNEEVLPTNGMIMIIPSGRKHSAVYEGKKDRVMVGVNFYLYK